MADNLGAARFSPAAKEKHGYDHNDVIRFAPARNETAVRAWIARTEEHLAHVKEHLAAGKPGHARIASLVEEQLSPRAGLAELVAAFEEVRPGIRNELGFPWLLARQAADPTFPAEFSALDAAANTAEFWSVYIQDAAARGNRETLAEAIDGLVDATLKAARALDFVRGSAVQHGGPSI